MWFVNSLKFVNHNSADVYRFDPQTRSTRYERHLFSQDSGQPVVHDGLLYWPFEDARFSAGRGELMVTNGVDWRWHEIPQGLVFHTHAMHAVDDTLYAATSGWKAQLHRFDGDNRQWRMFYEHPTAERRVSRFTSLASLDGKLYAGLSSRTQTGPKLLVVKDGEVSQLPDWPHGTAVNALQHFGDWIYALNISTQGRRVWRTDGARVEPVSELDGEVIRDFAAGDEYLWAVSGQSGRGALWRTKDGLRWQRVQVFDKAVPLDITTHQDDIYVGTRGPGPGGALWGPVVPTETSETGQPPPALWDIPEHSAREVDTLASLLDAALQDGREFGDYVQRLQGVLSELASIREEKACEAIHTRLLDRHDERPVSAIGGNVTVPLAYLNRWYLLRALLMCGHRVALPGNLWHIEWNEPANSSEKYFHPLPAAAWVLGELGAPDDSNLAGLIGQLGKGPAFIDGDLIGALSLLSGQRLGYDIDAWYQWWAEEQGMRAIPAGVLEMGSDNGEPSESPVHVVKVSAFFLDRFEVTNRAFSAFVEATQYTTDVEHTGKGWHWERAWEKIPHADWRHPHGPGSSIQGLEEHPVVQVSWNDAKAFCRWRGKRLPTEAEWEHAARGATGRTFAWGDQPPRDGDKFRASFGADRCCKASDEDGFLYTAPVGSFPPSHPNLELFDLTGNVWEWVEDSFAPDYYQRSPEHDPVNRQDANRKVIRGGGWGNNPWGLRATLRHANPPDSGLSMVGIRCAL